jgi:hypothetical protein
MSAIEIRRWSREEVEKIIEAGIMPPGLRAKLLDGDLLDKCISIAHNDAYENHIDAQR